MRIVRAYHTSALGANREAVDRLLRQEHGISFVRVANVEIPFGKAHPAEKKTPRSAKHLIETAKPLITDLTADPLVKKLASLSQNPLAAGGSAPSREASDIEEHFLKTGRRHPSAIYKLTLPAPLWSAMRELGVELYRCECLCHTCATGNHALKVAVESRADFAVVLAAEDTLSPSRTAGYVKVGLLATKSSGLPLPCIFPFQELGDNTVIGAGGGVMILATDELLKQAGEHPEEYPEVVAAASIADTYGITATSPEGKALEKAIRDCLEQAGWKPDDVHVVKAHATGTMMNDSVEAGIYSNLFRNAVITFLKQYTGHTFLASAAVENALLFSCLLEGYIPAPILKAPLIPEARGLWIPEKPVEVRGEIRVLSVACGFAGLYSAVAFRFHS